MVYYHKPRLSKKITFKLVQIKFLAMHITNKKIFLIYLQNYGNLLNIFMEQDLYLIF